MKVQRLPETLCSDLRAVMRAAEALYDATRYGEQPPPVLVANLDAAAHAAVHAVDGDGPATVRMLAMLVVLHAHDTERDDPVAPLILGAAYGRGNGQPCS